MNWTLITGGAKRLGREIALDLAARGHNILIHYRDSEVEAQEAAARCRTSGVKADIVQGDLSTLESVNHLLQDLKDVKHLINNVGAFYEGSAMETPPSKWLELYTLNVLAPIALSQGLISSISEHRGSIINIGSAGCGRLIANMNYTAYYSTKLALLHWTKSAAKELAKRGVRVNMVSPGELEISDTLALNLDKLPMGRAGTCSEAAQAVAFFLDDANGYITGQNLEVSGGFAL